MTTMLIFFRKIRRYKSTRRLHYKISSDVLRLQGHLLQMTSPASTVTYHYNKEGPMTDIQSPKWTEHLTTTN